MKKYFLLAFIVFGFISINAQEKYTTEEASKHIGEDAVVSGVITQISTPRNGITYLNIDGKFPDNIFTGVIFKKDASVFENIKELEGKNVELTGKIEEYKGKPQIILKKPEQIKIIE